MKKTNVHHREQYTRQNNLKENMVRLFISFMSFPKLWIEVFLRSRFGKSYFNLGSALGVTIIMFVLPFFMQAASMSYSYFQSRTYGFDLVDFLIHYLSWYAMLTAFVVKSIKHRLAMKTETGVFNFNWYSKSSGVIHPFFRELEINGWCPSERQLEIFVEPAVPFIAGLFLCLLSQPIGIVLVICAIIYSGSYAALYYLGDRYIQDIIDSIIVNKVKQELFVGDKTAEDTMGVRLRADRPSAEEVRMTIYEQAVKDDEDIAEVF